MEHAKALSTPLTSGLQLLRRVPTENCQEYKLVVEALYITTTRIEIYFSVNKVCQFM